MRRVLHERREATPSPPPPPDACLAMRRRHGVVPHVTWGTLPQAEQATWSVLGCDLQLEQQPTKTEPPKPVPETEPLKQHGAGDAPPAAVAAPVRNKTSSRGVPLWLEPSHTNLLFNSHAQAQLAPYEPARTTLHFTFGSAVMMDFVKNWLHFAKKAGLTPYLVGTADTGMGTVSVAIVSVAKVSVAIVSVAIVSVAIVSIAIVSVAIVSIAIVSIAIVSVAIVSVAIVSVAQWV